MKRRGRQKKNRVLLAVLMAVLLGVSCGKRYVPRPYGYWRIEIPDTAYTAFAEDTLPYAFDLSDNAIAEPIKGDNGERCWINVKYPTLNATLHCSYKPVKNNLGMLSDETQKFVYKHAMKAEAIPEQGYEHPEKHVYGVYYELQGNTASPIQFVLTDSTANFFRAALYFNARPNQDSIQPVLDYMRGDIIRMIESFEWKDVK